MRSTTVRRLRGGLGLEFWLLAFLALYLTSTAAWAVGSGPGAAVGGDAVAGRIQHLLHVRQGTLVQPAVLSEAYAERQYRALWDDPAQARQALEVLAGADSHGLDPSLFNLAELTRRLAERDSSGDFPAGERVEQRASLDIDISDSLLHFALALRFGVLDPDTNKPRRTPTKSEIDELAPVALRWWRQSPGMGKVSDLAGVSPLKVAFEAFLPKDETYQRLRAALAQYRAIERQGGWGEIGRGRTIEPGDSDPRLAAIASRLRLTGDLGLDKQVSTGYFDGELEQAVRNFQGRHGLEVDGRVGPSTLAAMNVPVTERIDQIRVNLERTRWHMWDLPSRYILVDIADFKTHLVERQKVVWSSRAIVGQRLRATPVLRSEMTHVVLNPTWTVPPGIIEKDMIPLAREDADAIARKGLRLVDSRGGQVSPDEVDWESVTARNFPYRLWQPAGPSNALGKVKFIFPNRHHVYLHGTPHQSLFKRTTRTFSSGCVRLEGAMDLAERLLSREPGWDEERVAGVSRSGRTTRVDLSEALPVFILYMTAGVDGDGHVSFRPDVYRSDPRVLQGIGPAVHQHMVRSDISQTQS